MRTSRAIRRRLPGEAGLTIVETMISAAILLGGLIAGFLAMESAQSATKTAERQAIAAAEAERQIERLQAKTWQNLVMCAEPAPESAGVPPGGVPENPNYYVQNTSPRRFKIMANYRDPNSSTLPPTPANGEAFVLPSGSPPSGCVPAAPLNFTQGTTTGKIYSYVTWRDDSCVVGLPGQLSSLVANLTNVVTALINGISNDVSAELSVFCAGTTDSKRITVAVVLDDASDYGPHKPTWISTIQTDLNNGLVINAQARYDF